MKFSELAGGKGEGTTPINSHQQQAQAEFNETLKFRIDARIVKILKGSD